VAGYGHIRLDPSTPPLRGSARDDIFDGNLAAVPNVVHEVDGGHAPFAGLTLDLVARGQAGAQRIGWSAMA